MIGLETENIVEPKKENSLSSHAPLPSTSKFPSSLEQVQPKQPMKNETPTDKLEDNVEEKMISSEILKSKETTDAVKDLENVDSVPNEENTEFVHNAKKTDNVQLTLEPTSNYEADASNFNVKYFLEHFSMHYIHKSSVWKILGLMST